MFQFFRRIFYFILMNLLILLVISVIGGIVIEIFDIKGQWASYLVFYSLFGFGAAFISLLMSRWLAIRTMGVRILEPDSGSEEERDLVSIVHDMARRARVPKPQVGIFEHPQPNAFATGPSKKKSLVAFSTGLLNQMNKEEIEGVAAHEVAHIANGDMITMTLLQGLINTMVLLAARFLAQTVANMARGRGHGRNFFLEFFLYMAFQIVLSLLGSILLCHFSRKREFRADKGGARFAGTENMVKALKALQRTYDRVLTEKDFQQSAKSSYSYLKISGKQKVSLFSTHPPLQARIDRLEKYIS